MIADTAEPVVRFFRRFDLKPFTFEDSKEAINIQLEAADSKISPGNQVIEKLTSGTKGHPYLITFAVFELLNM